MEQFQDMKGIIIITDDLVVYGTNREEHNLLQKCQTIGVKLNPEKLEIDLDAITFMAHRITKECIVVNPEKVRAITDMPSLGTVGDLRRFLGMINYVGKFIPNFTIVPPGLNKKRCHVDMVGITTICLQYGQRFHK